MQTTFTSVRLLLAAVLLVLAGPAALAQTSGVGIGTSTPAASAALEVKTSTQGFLPPRLTEAQRTALGTAGIAAPDPGLLVYQTDGTQPGFWYYAASGGWTYLNPNSTGSDNLGNGVATANLDLSTYKLVGNGGSSGLAVSSAGIMTTDAQLNAGGNINLGANKLVGNGGSTGITIANNGRVGIGIVGAPRKGLEVAGGVYVNGGGNVWIPATSTYRYQTPKTKRYTISAAELLSINPAVYERRIDEGFSSASINGLNSLWAAGGTPGTVAYFTAAVHLPDSAVVTGLNAQLVKNGGSLQSVVELYRTDYTGYLGNTAQLIATATTTNSGGGIAYVSAASVNTSYNVIDNTNYSYFIRYSGEQATQNLRFSCARIIYQIYRSEY
jgi:hypothetical protein